MNSKLASLAGFPLSPVQLLFLLFLIAAVPPRAFSQTEAGFSGTVQDAQGHTIAAASVAVKALETASTRTVLTDEAGAFRVLGLPVGPYEVAASKSGFKTAVRNGLYIEVGQVAVVNLRLEVGELSQQIVVSEEVPVVNTTPYSVSGVVSEQEIKDLPLNGRSFDTLITLNPGALNYVLKSANTSTSNGNTFSVDGRRTYENLFLLNGIEYTGSSQLGITPGGVSGDLLGVEAIREFNVLTDTYSAAYGKRAGAQVSAVTQSGSNALHGSIYEYLRNSVLDASSYFAQGGAPPFEQNQFGGAAGGPLKRDKVFVFGNYEGFRQKLAVSNVSVVPDAAARQGMLPNTTTGVEAPVAGLNPAMLQYMQFWPQPNGGELLSNGKLSGTALSYNEPTERIREDFGTARADLVASDRDTFSGIYTIDDGTSLIPLADPLFASTTTLRMQVASVQEQHVFSPNVLNTFRFGYSRAGFNLDSTLLANFPSNLDFITGEGPGGITIGGGVTTTGAAALTSAGPNNAAGVFNRRNLFTLADDVLVSKGAHQITFGVWFQRVQDNEDSASRQTGQATFSTLASFLQGTTSTFQVVPTPTELGWRSLFGAWYVEDAIKVTPRLTIRAGLRDEFTTGWNEAEGRAANYVPNTAGVLLTAPLVGDSVYTQNNAKALFSPRVGLAWDVFGDGRTAVRAGLGTYYSLIDDLAFLLNSLPPYNGALTYSGALSSFTPIVHGAAPPPTCGPGIAQPCATYAPQGVQANAKTPTVEEWNLTIEQRLTRHTSFRIAYVGSHGYHGYLSVDLNSIPAQICASASGCTAGGASTSGTPATVANQSTVRQGAEYIPVGTRPNPYLGAGFFWITQGNSSYNALQTELSHQLGTSLQFRASYTWSKNLDMNSGLTGAQASNQAQMILDRTDLRRDWGPSAQNIANAASISGSYELPFGSGRRFPSSMTGHAGDVSNFLIGGWQFNAIATLQSGFPFTPLIGSNRSGDGDTRNPDRPSFNPAYSGPILLRQPTEWYNPNAFVLPAAGTFGNVGRGNFTGPGLADLDLSLLKDTALTERMKLEFRVEFFNILNRVNFGVPNTTAFASGVPSASAGLITTLATNPRQIQFALKLIY